MAIGVRRAELTGSALSACVSQWMARGLIKSVQRGTTTIGVGTQSNTGAITAVDTNNAIVMHLSANQAGAETNLSRIVARVRLTNATTVTASTAGNVTAAFVVGYEVIEFMPGVLKSLQRGQITMGGVASQTATITAVDTSKSVTYQGGMTNSLVTAQANTVSYRLELTNATTVTAKNDGASGTVEIPFQVAEFY